MNFLNDLKYNLACLPLNIKYKIFNNNKKKESIKYITEKENWAIKIVGQQIQYFLSKNFDKKIQLSHYPNLYGNSILHFGSQYMWTNWYKYLSKTNKYISTYFHGKFNDGTNHEDHINQFIESSFYLSKIITASNIVQSRLLEFGIEKDKVLKIPLGVDTNYFKPNESNKFKIKDFLGIPNKSFVIGSFQKDGIGWKNGLKPKLIKGPDILVDTLINLKKNNLPIYVVLTGPARGFVKKKLIDNNINYKHFYPKEHKELAKFYQILDLYLISSREEGGPLSLLESLACGIPVISTKVGMSPDILVNGQNGFIVNSFNSKDLSDKIMEFYSNSKKKYIKNFARNSILNYDWSNIAELYYKKVYLPLIL